MPACDELNTDFTLEIPDGVPCAGTLQVWEPQKLSG